MENRSRVIVTEARVGEPPKRMILVGINERGNPQDSDLVEIILIDPEDPEEYKKVEAAYNKLSKKLEGGE